jgi:hypothetical protein
MGKMHCLATTFALIAAKRYKYPFNKSIALRGAIRAYKQVLLMSCAKVDADHDEEPRDKNQIDDRPRRRQTGAAVEKKCPAAAMPEGGNGCAFRISWGAMAGLNLRETQRAHLKTRILPAEHKKSPA